MFLILLVSVGIFLNTAKAVTEATPKGEIITESMQFVDSLHEVKKYEVVNKVVYCNCVLYAKKLLGISESLGIAKDIKIDHIPQAGKLVITNEGKYGHVAIVTAIRNGLLYLKEANYIHCKESERTLPIDAPIIRGYH